MRILSRLLLSILPPLMLVIVAGSTLVLQVSAAGVTQQERNLLQFKSRQMENQIISQWNLLVEFRLYYEPELIRAAQRSLSTYASSLTSEFVKTDSSQSPDGLRARLFAADDATEAIFALVRDESGLGRLIFSTDESVSFSAEESDVLLHSGPAEDGVVEFAIANIGGVQRAYTSFAFEPFDWVVYVSESASAFRWTQSIIRAISIAISAVVVMVSTLIIIVLARSITKPLHEMSKLTRIITRDAPEISTSLPIIFHDESGALAQDFNSLLAVISKNYRWLKQYTYDNIVIRKRESRVKTIFQKYVPQALIDRYVQRPESLLQGEKRTVAVLFLDVRNFTAMSESMPAENVVKMLNLLFHAVVTEVIRYQGHVDKYIGDSVMAVFGVPVSTKFDALHAVHAAISIRHAVTALNASAAFSKFPKMNIGIGVHYGDVVAGNIGCEAKIEYTVIGNTVNIASRIEGLCKAHNRSLLISKEIVEQMQSELEKERTIRFVARVQVKGKTEPVEIYTIVDDDSYDPGPLRLHGATLAPRGDRIADGSKQ